MEWYIKWGGGGIELRRKEAFGGRVGSLLYFHFTGTLIFHANCQATQEKFGQLWLWREKEGNALFV